jgi:riboflavin synthase
MFTGIISKTSKVKKVKSTMGGLSVGIASNFGKVKTGESIAVNGVCSTITSTQNKILSFEYMPETLKLSNLGFLKKGDMVNLEKALRFGDRLDGHIVLGHIDGKGKIINIKKEGNSQVFEIKIPDRNFKKFLVYKGSVVVEGISLTVAKVSKESFWVKIIPYTIEHTNLRFKKKGDEVNLEFDILAKYAHANKK